MVRILYGFCGIGMGHYIRNKEIINELDKKHKILIVCSGEPYKRLSKERNNVYDTGGFELFFKNNRIINIKTIQENIKKLKLPLISIDNQHYLIYGKYKTPIRESFQKIKAEIILKSLVKEADIYIILLYPNCLLEYKKNFLFMVLIEKKQKIT